MNEQEHELISIKEDMWKNFIPMLLDAADSIHFKFELIRNDNIKILRFESEKSKNIFHLITGLKNALGSFFFRFISNICQSEEVVDFSDFLKECERMGLSLYIDDKMFDSAICLKYDHELIAGFPDDIWFEYFLRIFDANITVLKQQFNNTVEINNDYLNKDNELSGNNYFCGNCNGEMELTTQELKIRKFVCADCGFLNEI